MMTSEQAGLELQRVVSDWVTNHGMSVDDAVSCAVGFAIGAMQARYNWTPEKIGEECKKMAEQVYDEAMKRGLIRPPDKKTDE